MKERTRPSADWYRRKIFSMADNDYLIASILGFDLNNIS